MTGPGIFLPSSASHPAQNTPPADQPPAKKGIWVTDNGVLMKDGRAFDTFGLVFQLQSQVGKIAQARLSAIAKEIWNANRYSEMLVTFLNQMRGIRPDGKPGDKVEYDLMMGVMHDFEAKYDDHTPFWQLGLDDLFPGHDPAMKQYQIDQLIEGIRSKISEVNGNQRITQTDTEKFSHMVDEAKEAVSSIEKALFATMQVEASKQ